MAEATKDAAPRLHRGAAFALIFSFIFVLHAPLLRLPYFWDEAGYFVPAARDLWLTGDPIPTSTRSNAHPPLVMAYTAAWWALSGYKPAVTRTAMLLVAALALLAVFHLGRSLANRQVAVATVALTALYPVFFAQSSLAHLDMAAAALTLWAIVFYVNGRRAAAIGFSALAALAKETSLVVPLAFAAWELVCWARRNDLRWRERWCLHEVPPRAAFSHLLAAVPIGLWFAYHAWRTGYVFGSPEHLEYNLLATLNPLRIVLALLLRGWHLFGHMNLYVLTVAAALAMRQPPLVTGNGLGERPRIDTRAQAVLAAQIFAHAALFALAGGAALARYLLPVYPLVILLGVSTLWRRVRAWRMVLGVVALGFVTALFINPPYRFAPEDNLAYRDFVLLHRRAAQVLEQRFPNARVLTAWPASDELTKPYLGYVQQPFRVVRVENFTAEQMAMARAAATEFDVAFLFSTKYEPRRWVDFPAWERVVTRFFDYHRDLQLEAAVSVLGGRIVHLETRGGQWAAVVVVERSEAARLRP